MFRIECVRLFERPTGSRQLWANITRGLPYPRLAPLGGFRLAPGRFQMISLSLAGQERVGLERMLHAGIIRITVKRKPLTLAEFSAFFSLGDKAPPAADVVVVEEVVVPMADESEEIELAAGEEPDGLEEEEAPAYEPEDKPDDKEEPEEALEAPPEVSVFTKTELLRKRLDDLVALAEGYGIETDDSMTKKILIGLILKTQSA